MWAIGGERWERVGWLGYLCGTDSTSTFKLPFITELLNLEPLRGEYHAHSHTLHTHTRLHLRVVLEEPMEGRRQLSSPGWWLTISSQDR